MQFDKIFITIITFCYGIFIFSYPPSFSNDDSLFLSNGINYFSITDFSPHFPGYPALIIMGKFINLFFEDAKLSLFVLTASCSILTPAVIYFLCIELLNKKSALIAFILTITSPYLLNLSLTMLSDSVGLFFFFSALYFLEKNKNKTAGLIFSIALFSRPSYITLFVIGFIYICIYKKETLKDLILFFSVGMMIFVGFIFINEGLLYIIEAKRFIIGHFNLWGTGQNSQTTWFSNIFSLANLPYVLLIFCFFKFDKRLKLYYLFFIFYLLWILFAQNPHNIRHLIPLIFIANILISSFLINSKIYSLILITILNIYIIISISEKQSPIERILFDIKDDNKTIITNRGIEILREKQNNPVVDRYYEHSSNFIKKQRTVNIISTIKPKNKEYKSYKGRFIKEHTLYLYN